MMMVDGCERHRRPNAIKPTHRPGTSKDAVQLSPPGDGGSHIEHNTCVITSDPDTSPHKTLP